MGRVKHPASAAGLVLGVGAAAGFLDVGLVVGKEQQVAPFPQQGSHLLGGLHRPAVVAADVVGLLELGDGGMSQDHHIVPGVQDFFEGIQQPPELFL